MNKAASTTAIVDRILRERLEDFEVPSKLRNTIRDEILSIVSRPERNPSGACIMTPEASAASDQIRQGKIQAEDAPNPKIV